MELINKNIKFLRKQKSNTQQQFADALDIKRSLLGAYEEGRAKPNLQVMQGLAKMFNLSIDQLISDDIARIAENKLFGKQGGVDNDIKGNRLRVLSITVDEKQNENIELVPAKAAAGYLNGYADPEFIQELPRFRLSFLGPGTYRAFEIKGDSMIPIQPGTIVVSQYVDDWTDIKDGHTYIVLTKDDGLVYKRIFNDISENGSLTLRSDNPSYEPYSMNIEEVLEVWRAKAYISTVFPDANMSSNNMMEMLMNLQKEVSSLKDKSNYD